MLAVTSQHTIRSPLRPSKGVTMTEQACLSSAVLLIALAATWTCSLGCSEVANHRKPTDDFSLPSASSVVVSPHPSVFRRTLRGLRSPDREQEEVAKTECFSIPSRQNKTSILLSAEGAISGAWPGAGSMFLLEDNIKPEHGRPNPCHSYTSRHCAQHCFSAKCTVSHLEF